MALEKWTQCEKDGTHYEPPTGRQPKTSGIKCKTKLKKKAPAEDSTMVDDKKHEQDLTEVQNPPEQNPESDPGSDAESSESMEFEALPGMICTADGDVTFEKT